ncbi:MAG: hypothetical protein DRJ42_04240 [Deltaproteobacteria bacterium]|nr:MAG: hypothetical protein DRJ42_04240 [Deltaproteobacteria bacterium]
MQRTGEPSGEPLPSRKRDRTVAWVPPEDPVRPLLTCLIALLLWPAAAVAQSAGASDVSEGRRFVQEARFDEAMEAFERAAESTDLGWEDVIALLEGQAMVHHARGDDAAFERAAAAIASIAPAYAPAREVPPRLSRRLRAATDGGAQLALVATAERSGDSLVVGAELSNDPGRVVNRVVISAEVGANELADHLGPRVSIPARPSEGVRWYAQAIGPGGAVVASFGSADSPNVVPAEALPVPTVVEPASVESDVGEPTQDAVGITGSGVEESDDGGLPLWPFIVGGVVLAAVIVAVVVFVFTSDPEVTSEIPGIPL